MAQEVVYKKLSKVYQLRVSARKGFFKNIIVNYDSTVVFDSIETAKEYLPDYVQQLLTLGIVRSPKRIAWDIVELNVTGG